MKKTGQSSEPTEYQLDLFYWMSVRLMAMKYAYYVKNDQFVDDLNYDLSEKDWYRFGRELGLLEVDETSPCIDFDWEHPMAQDAKILGEYYLNRCVSNPEVEDLFKRYKQE